ncbi:MAG: MBL fold metallo-hydrolase [Deltaproteobacteria bacterium]|nr:MBL fold metallo-hydrolase [Deltaproteobacteria bacterium]MBW1846599.1 MBL fold metallo-hydrolase [Deltaproteobacteria bacterium]MBW2181076.1 MBL fold metallo-hydrolase [Deltaproteobacteria bacterium]MBW2365711.1 MBL fold metallo-hydrolase [Deltaproteobacteria bacterium]
MRRKDTLNYSEEVYPGIYRITLPLPGDRPGPVNAYLFIGENITLLDTGTARTVRNLKTAFNGFPFKFTDIDQIIITHGHIDHYGAADHIVKKSGNSVLVVAHREDVQRIETGMEVSRKVVLDFYRLIGIPDIHIRSWQLMNTAINAMADNCRVDTVLADGDTIQMGDYMGKVISTPGHSKGSICIFIENKGILFSGDHIIGHITPNAFVMLEEDEKLPVRLSQTEFYESLSKIEALKPTLVYPAHGKTITDLDMVARFYRSCFFERRDKILSILDSGEKNVYKIARKLFPEISGPRLPLDIYLAVSEVYTHIQTLESENKVHLNIRNDTLEITRVDTEN